MEAMRWFVLGFDYDAVAGAWQDWRLARQCALALRDSGLPTNDIRHAAGQGPYLTYWYVNAVLAEALDRGGVPWRRFVIGEVRDCPSLAAPLLKGE